MPRLTAEEFEHVATDAAAWFVDVKGWTLKVGEKLAEDKRQELHQHMNDCAGFALSDKQFWSIWRGKARGYVIKKPAPKPETPKPAPEPAPMSEPKNEIDKLYYELNKRITSCHFDREETNAITFKVYQLFNEFMDARPGSDAEKEKQRHQYIIWRIMNNKECQEPRTIDTILDIHFSIHHFMRKWRSGDACRRFSFPELLDLFAIATHSYDLKDFKHWIINKETQEADIADFLDLDVKEFSEGLKRWISERLEKDEMI